MNSICENTGENRFRVHYNSLFCALTAWPKYDNVKLKKMSDNDAGLFLLIILLAVPSRDTG